MEVLSPLCLNLFPDSAIAAQMNSKRTKTTQLLKKALAPSFEKELTENLKEPGCFFSIVMDETTDRGSIKQCAFVVTYYEKQQGKFRSRFFDLVETPGCTANDLTKCLKNCFQRQNIPWSNFIGFSSDTTNVMFGQNQSVVANLKKDFPLVAFIKCSCHMIHLVASKACLKLPRSVEDLLRNLGSHFSRSFQRQEKFKEFQEFFQVEIYKILSPSTTCWLSLQACVNRVLELYVPLKMYLRESLFQDPSKTVEEMLNTMDNVFTRAYLEFMSYALSLFNDFNTLFQSDHSLLHSVKPEIEKLLRTVCSNYLEISAVKKINVLLIDHSNP
uniref:DUF4371 domain-containing protein n=1 Tax=Graphocephala atropunctata TaxID=36148 RepID=A0A1B6KJL5_9HEMI